MQHQNLTLFSDYMTKTSTVELRTGPSWCGGESLPIGTEMTTTRKKKSMDVGVAKQSVRVWKPSDDFHISGLSLTECSEGDDR